ncbi:MAG: ATP-binding protein [Alphaproteobacteria bacterium]
MTQLEHDILDNLAHPILVIGDASQIVYANGASELFFGASQARLINAPFAEFVPFGTPLLALVEQVQHRGGSISEYGVRLGTPRTGHALVDVQASRMTPSGANKSERHVLVMLQERSIATAMDRQLTHRGAARSVTAMAAMLAHEIKNPLSGIRGAAQLLELDSPPESRELTRLIMDEADRIVKLVDRMEVFSNERPIEREPVNIHEVLNHVRRLSEAGFGSKVKFVENYDPSLPPVMGERDQLIQVMLNLIKNACEAVPEQGGLVTLSTSYRHGVKIKVPGSQESLSLPLEVCVMDNGPGVPDELRPNLFDPFVTTKPKGQGLGLAMVAKIVGDHGGVIECESEPGQTVFRVFLPVSAK